MTISVESLQPFYESLYFAAFHLTKALTAAIQRDSYLYWPFLVSSVVLAAFTWRVILWRKADPARRSWREFVREYFGAALWWHRSARADYRLYLANALVLPLLFGYLMFNEAQVAGAIDAALGRAAGAVESEAASAGIISGALFTLAFFVAFDFGRFVAHSLLHDVRFLWEFHKVHHSAEVLTPITSFRAHPVELLVMSWAPVITTGIVTWLFNWRAAGSVTFYTFLGLHVLIWGFNLIGNLRHSPVWLSYGPGVGRWLISPAHHQLHHSYEERHLGCNRGFEIALWDRLYGTLYVPPVQPEAFRMGLGDGSEARFHGLARMYLEPFAGAAREIVDLFRRPPSQSRP